MKQTSLAEQAGFQRYSKKTKRAASVSGPQALARRDSEPHCGPAIFVRQDIDSVVGWGADARFALAFCVRLFRFVRNSIYLSISS